MPETSWTRSPWRWRPGRLHLYPPSTGSGYLGPGDPIHPAHHATPPILVGHPMTNTQRPPARAAADGAFVVRNVRRGAEITGAMNVDPGGGDPRSARRAQTRPNERRILPVTPSALPRGGMSAPVQDRRAGCYSRQSSSRRWRPLLALRPGPRHRAIPGPNRPAAEAHAHHRDGARAGMVGGAEPAVDGQSAGLEQQRQIVGTCVNAVILVRRCGAREHGDRRHRWSAPLAPSCSQLILFARPAPFEPSEWLTDDVGRLALPFVGVNYSAYAITIGFAATAALLLQRARRPTRIEAVRWVIALAVDVAALIRTDTRGAQVGAILAVLAASVAARWAWTALKLGSICRVMAAAHTDQHDRFRRRGIDLAVNHWPRARAQWS